MQYIISLQKKNIGHFYFAKLSDEKGKLKI